MQNFIWPYVWKFHNYIIIHNENSICGSKDKIHDKIRHTIIDVLSLEDSRKNKILLHPSISMRNIQHDISYKDSIQSFCYSIIKKY